MTSRQRIGMILEGNPPDRPAASFWRHHPRHEITASGLVDATLSFQRRFGWDIVKINPRAEYHSEVWGNRYAFYEDDHRRPRLIEPRVKSPGDWHTLEVVDPTDGVLGEHLEAVRRIREELEDVPVLMTVFTPLSIAAELAGVRDTQPSKIFADGEDLEAGLETITVSFQGFVRELMAAGCDGLFFATTRLGTRNNLDDAAFGRFSRPYDLKLLGAAQQAWLNMLHVCGSRAMLDLTLDYPTHLLSWDMADPTNPGLEEIVHQSKRPVIGGVAQALTADPGRRAEVVEQARGVLQSVGSHRVVVGAGCVLPTRVDASVLGELRRFVEEPGSRL